MNRRMMARSHTVLGVTAWVAAAHNFHVPVLDPWALFFALAGSLLPDIDHPQSWIGRRSRLVSRPVAAVFRHRGATHSALAVLGLIILAMQAGHWKTAVIALTIGYVSHLAADMLTPAGVPLGWPSRRSWGLPLCRTGSPVEAIIVVALVGALVWWRLGGDRVEIFRLGQELRHLLP
jgi:inner membrane protein